jgi:hypothetical protein
MPELPIYTAKTPVKFVKLLRVFIFDVPYHFVLYTGILRSRNLLSLTENTGQQSPWRAEHVARKGSDKLKVVVKW